MDDKAKRKKSGLNCKCFKGNVTDKQVDKHLHLFYLPDEFEGKFI